VRLRRQLQLLGPDAADQWALYRLDRAGQLATMSLYDLADTEPIAAFTEKEATRLLEYMVWDHSREEDYITEATVEGARQRRTWKSDISTPDSTAHLAGERYSTRSSATASPTTSRSYSGSWPAGLHEGEVGDGAAEEGGQYPKDG
jgi:hypothetical protein